MNFRQPAIYVIIVISLVLAFGWTYYSNKKKTADKQATTATTTATSQTKTSVSNLTNISPSEFDSLTTKTYTLADEKALLENSENRIAAIEVKIDENLSPDTTITRYIFNSPNDTKNNWVMTFSSSGNQYVRALTPTEDYMGALKPMNTKAWKYNYVTALQIAEKNGGLSWRESKKLTGVKLTLMHTGKKSWLLWTVEYQSDEGNFTILLDANSGKVVTE